jgi:hypothetical protein
VLEPRNCYFYIGVEWVLRALLIFLRVPTRTWASGTVPGSSNFNASWPT